MLRKPHTPGGLACNAHTACIACIARIACPAHTACPACIASIACIACLDCPAQKSTPHARTGMHRHAPGGSRRVVKGLVKCAAAVPCAAHAQPGACRACNLALMACNRNCSRNRNCSFTHGVSCRQRSSSPATEPQHPHPARQARARQVRCSKRHAWRLLRDLMAVHSPRAPSRLLRNLLQPRACSRPQVKSNQKPDLTRWMLCAAGRLSTFLLTNQTRQDPHTLAHFRRCARPSGRPHGLHRQTGW